jgi:archaellum component FlaC
MKIWSYLSVVLLILASSAALWFFFTAEREAAAAATLEANLQREMGLLREARDEAMAERDQVERRLADMDRELAAVKARSTTLSTQARQAQLEVRQLQETNQGLESERSRLEDQLARFRRELLEARAQPAGLSADERAELEEEIADLRARLVRTTGGSITAGQPSTDGLNVAILRISPLRDVVAVNAGRADGLTIDRTAHLRQGDAPAVRVRFTDVRDGFSLARVLDPATASSLATGGNALLILQP